MIGERANPMLPNMPLYPMAMLIRLMLLDINPNPVGW